MSRLVRLTVTSVSHQGYIFVQQWLNRRFDFVLYYFIMMTQSVAFPVIARDINLSTRWTGHVARMGTRETRTEFGDKIRRRETS
jgi:hypothetical protein